MEHTVVAEVYKREIVYLREDNNIAHELATAGGKENKLLSYVAL